MKNNYKAFTLAEVLITLGIIGIVASLTLPAIIQKQNEKATVTALKKFYSSISQAYLFAKNEYGSVNEWYSYSEESTQSERSKIAAERLSKYMKNTRVCYEADGCFPDMVYNRIDGQTAGHLQNTDYSRLITSDGMNVLIDVEKREKYDFLYTVIIVDINGYKKPNTIGRDTFSFILLKDKIIPTGAENASQLMPVTKATFPDDCNRKKCTDICTGCTAWVIYNENLDYLHCDNLSWQGKKTCK